MADAMKADERPAPVDVGLFGAPAVMQKPNVLPKLISTLVERRPGNGGTGRGGRNAAR
jgi:hypothetical protein